MPDIHPTAIVDTDADIESGVKIGPFCIVEGDTSIGSGTVLESSVRVIRGTHIGKNNTISHGAAFGGLPQSIGFDPNIKSGLIIGDNNTFREQTVFHRGTVEGKNTIIGNHNYFMSLTHMGHDVEVGDYVVLVQSAVVAGHTIVEDYAFIGGMSAFHQNIKVGTYSMTGGCSKVVKDVAPFSTIDGNPARTVGLNALGMKRAGIDPEIRKKIKQTFKTIFHSGLNTTQALKQLAVENDPAPEIIMIREFFETSKRGVTDYR